MYLITWITTHLPTPEGWMAELAKARSMQPYIVLYKSTLHAAGCEKLAQGFYTAATWLGIEPSIYDTLVRRSTSKPPSHLIRYFTMRRNELTYSLRTRRHNRTLSQRVTRLTDNNFITRQLFKINIYSLIIVLSCVLFIKRICYVML